jgi:purine-binding chemotaxis protein CheW
MAGQPNPAERAQYLGFYIGGEEYAIGILRVREILEYDTVTKVPTTPPSIRGVINLRGSVVPVVDLAVKFGLPESVVSKRTCIVVVEVDLDGERAVMGVLADAVSQVIDLPASEVEPPPPFGTRVRVDCLIGMGRAGRKFVLLLDIDKLLSLDELEITRQEAGTSDLPHPEGTSENGETSPSERDQPVSSAEARS